MKPVEGMGYGMKSTRRAAARLTFHVPRNCLPFDMRYSTQDQIQGCF